MRLRFIVLFLLLLGCMLVTSVSFAWTFDDFLYFADSIKGEVSSFDASINKIKAQETAIRNLIGNTNFTGFVCQGPNATTGGCDIYCFDGPLRITSRNNTSLSFQFTTASTANRCVRINIYSSGNPSKNQWQNLSSFHIYPSNGGSYGLFETSNEWTDWTGLWFQNKYVEPYTGPVFTPANNGQISVYNNGTLLGNATRLPFGYVFPTDVTLGYISNYDDTFYGFEGNFGPIIYISGDGSISDNSGTQFTYTSFYGYKNSGLYFDFSTGRVSVSASKLIPNQAYNLELYCKQNYYDDWNDNFAYGDYYAYYYNDVSPSSGEAISPNLTTDVDIAWINAFGDLTTFDDNTKDNIDYNLNTLFGVGSFISGDYWSGDLLANLGVERDYFDNDYSLWLYSIYRNVLDIFTSPTLLDEGITVSVHEWSMTIYPSDFTIPPGPIKTFVTLFLITGIMFLLVQQFHSLCLTIATIDIIGVSSSFNRQHTFFM